MSYLSELVFHLKEMRHGVFVTVSSAQELWEFVIAPLCQIPSSETIH